MSNEQIERLEHENKKLHEELKKLREEKLEFASHQIYKKAQTKFIGWFSIVIVVLTAFGFVSINNIIQSINNKIEKKGIETIIEEIKVGFIKEHQSRVVNETVIKLMPLVRASVEVSVKEELVKKIIEAEKQVTDDKSLGKVLENKLKAEQYYVIVASSPDYGELLSLQEKYSSIVKANDIPSLGIYPPRNRNENYALVFDLNLTSNKAEELRLKAIKLGFRGDSYVSKSK